MQEIDPLLSGSLSLPPKRKRFLNYQWFNKQLITNPFFMLILILTFLLLVGLLISFFQYILDPLKIFVSQQSAPKQRGLLQQIKYLTNRTIQNNFLEEELSLLETLHQQTISNGQNIKNSQIITPSIDQNNYKYLQLPNKLKVLIIQDITSNSGSAALCVNAGSWQEPEEFSGLAHFLEHMLFQGSSKYPNMSYFENYVAKYGGYDNAYTTAVRTNYYFQIANSGFYQALDIFANFFVEPLFSEHAVYKEVNAVNSEYEIDVSEDGWKLYHLISLLSNPAHPNSRFSIGNLESLNKKGVVQALKTFFDQFYSSNLMALVIKSRNPISEVESWLLKSDFQMIKNKELPIPSYHHFGLPIQKDKLSSLVKFSLKEKTKSVVFVMQLSESEEKNYKSKPLEMINQILQSKHKEGLKEYLLTRGLALEIDATTYIDSNNAFDFFFVEFVLPESPIQIDKTDVFHLTNLLHSYFLQIKNKLFNKENNEPTNYLRKYWEQLKFLGKIDFDFKQFSGGNPLKNIYQLSHNLLIYPKEDVISAPYLWKHFDYKVILKVLNELTDLKNMIIIIGDDQYKFGGKKLENKNKQENMDFDKKFIQNTNLEISNKLYRLEYSHQKLSQESLNFIQKNIVPFLLPPINNYVPKNLEMKSLCVGESSEKSLVQIKQMPLFYTSKEECLKNELKFEDFMKFPQLIQHNLEGKVWWRLERTYRVPQIFMGLKIQKPFLTLNLDHEVKLKILDEFLEDAVLEKISQALEAGYSLRMGSDMKGLSFVFFGWSEKFKKFFEDVVKEVAIQTSSKHHLNDQQRFNRAKQNLITQHENIHEGRMYKIVLEFYLDQIMIADQHSSPDYIKHLNQTTFLEFKSFASTFLDNFRFTAFVTGNIFQEEAEDLIQSMKVKINIFSENNYTPQSQRKMLKVYNIKGKSIVMPFISESTDHDDINGVTFNLYQIGYRDSQRFAIMKLLEGKIANQAFEFLRTQHQLGYSVQARFITVGCQDSMFISVQGTNKNPQEVNLLIDDFLREFYNYLKQISEEEFKMLKKTAASHANENIQSFKQLASFQWSKIRGGDGSFDENEILINSIKRLSLSEVIAFYEEVFKSSTSGKLSIQIYGKGMVKKMVGSLSTPNWQQMIEKNLMKADDAFNGRTEKVFFGFEQFTKSIQSVWYCTYNIGNS